MSTVVNASRAWLKRTFAWSNSRQAWEERAAFLVLAIGVALIWLWGGGLSLVQRVGLWALVLMLFTLMLRRG